MRMTVSFRAPLVKTKNEEMEKKLKDKNFEIDKLKMKLSNHQNACDQASFEIDALFTYYQVDSYDFRYNSHKIIDIDLINQPRLPY